MTTQTIRTAIRATPPQVWQALTDGAVTPAYAATRRHLARVYPTPG